MAELHEVDAWLDALLAQLEPSARARMLREVARDVRRIQQANITAQRAPDGTAWEPRRATARTKPGRIRHKMFAKLKTTKYLKAEASAEQAEIAFAPVVQRLARVHHYGLRDKVNKRGKRVKYAERPLLGVNDEVEASIKTIILDWLNL
ncbi:MULTISPECIES: phage virion morphogenesis protein [Pantoea]|jgi:phage virion morphogenesis protein|uniref:Phage virion morphogenesis protein n=2 Tax=root TaxID=1 RepID=A0A7Y6TTR2_9GAMM|nr:MULTISPECIES: phage virion morphogenesis protein [Pantoea]DAF98627.1 MAG TPA: virion morphogenesis protein [Peduovirinae sp. ctOza1]MBZ6395582.1 phage virion morphogenesis protein [Pantoea sp.]MBZ6439206.1 phage virion morphogenesis protein [Pantoea sp.]MDU7866183.1 phage virion morphogenesis protein [Pantoea sp.]NUY43599.1 phage virion morphogenesis protein [Pantoea brenneri]